MVSVKLYVEGGGGSKTLKTACRKGFQRFIEKAGLQGRMPRVVACGSRRNAYESFKTAHAGQDTTVLLLVDAEGPVTAESPWQHLEIHDNWDRPDHATDDQCHLMVQIMESWFLADPQTLKTFYGQGYRPDALPSDQHVERIAKRDVSTALPAPPGIPRKAAMIRGRTASGYWRNWTRKKSRTRRPMRNA